MSERDTLQAALESYQATGDFAAEAETLMALVKMTQKDIRSSELDNQYKLLEGLCLQTYAAYKRLGHKKGMTSALKILIDTIYSQWDEEWHAFRWPVANTEDTIHTFHVVAMLYGEMGDLREQAEVYKAIGVIARGEIGRIALNQAVMCYQTMGMAREQGMVLQSLARIYAWNSPEEQHYLKQALALFIRINDRQQEHRVRVRLAYIKRHNSGQTGPMTVESLLQKFVNLLGRLF